MADVDFPREHVDSEDVGLALLGFASGSMDALAFFNLGEVFPSAMTGNTALLGLALGQGCGFRLIRPPIPIRSRPLFRFQIAHPSDFKSPGGSGPSGTLIFWHW
jgi:Protein of unknown function (DUF1275)